MESMGVAVLPVALYRPISEFADVNHSINLRGYTFMILKITFQETAYLCCNSKSQAFRAYNINLTIIGKLGEGWQRGFIDW